MTLFIRKLKTDLPGLLGWGILMAALALGYMSFYKVMITSGSLKDLASLIDNLPAMFKGLLGGSNLSTIDGFVQALVFGGMSPLLMVVYTCLGSLGLVTREVDDRNMEYLLSFPVTRTRVILSRAGALALQLLILQAILVLCAWGGGIAVGKSPDLGLYALAGFGSWLTYVALAGLFVWISVYIDDFQKGVFLLMGLAFILFFSGIVVLGDAKGNPTSFTKLMSWCNPYMWIEVRTIFADRALPVWGTIATVSLAAVSWFMAVRSFIRKQLP